jgi:hypothetical protein
VYFNKMYEVLDAYTNFKVKGQEIPHKLVSWRKQCEVIRKRISQGGDIEAYPAQPEISRGNVFPFRLLEQMQFLPESVVMENIFAALLSDGTTIERMSKDECDHTTKFYRKFCRTQHVMELVFQRTWAWIQEHAPITASDETVMHACRSVNYKVHN